MKKTAAYAVLICVCAVTLLPFLWMVGTSFKSAGETFSMPPIFIPDRLLWQNYRAVQKEIPLLRYFFNSLLVTVGITAGTLVTTVMAAFAFSMLDFWGRDVIFALFVATMIVPGEATLIPNYVAISKLGWLDSYAGLIVPWTVSVFSIFLLRQFFLTIPASLYRAAKVDGCGDLRYIFSIMVPAAKPALITIALLRVINSWNEFVWPLIVTNDPELRTLPVALTVFTNETSSRYNLMMAAATVIIAPVIAVYLLMQKYVIAGITKSGIKE